MRLFDLINDGDHERLTTLLNWKGPWYALYTQKGNVAVDDLLRVARKEGWDDDTFCYALLQVVISKSSRVREDSFDEWRALMAALDALDDERYRKTDQPTDGPQSDDDDDDWAEC